jgi:putative ABC transport system substrate-binding protein
VRGSVTSRAPSTRSSNHPAAFDAGIRGHTEGLLTTAESIVASESKRVVELPARHRLPGLYPYRVVVDSGGLMAYDSYTLDLLGRSATYVDKILKGAKPSDLPVRATQEFELIINLKAAKALGLTISPSPLLRADQIVE